MTVLHAVFGFDGIFFGFSVLDDFFYGFAVSNRPQCPPRSLLNIKSVCISTGKPSSYSALRRRIFSTAISELC